MELNEILKRLSAIEEPSATVVTVALDLPRATPPHAEAGGFHRNRLLDLLGAGERPESERETLRGVSGRLSLYLEKELQPGTEGLILVAGPGLWETFALGVPVRESIHVGRTPYLAPLLEALTRMPRAYVLRFDQKEGILEEVWKGVRREIVRIPSEAVERHEQHQMSAHSTRSPGGSSRSGTRMGGGGRDRYEQCVEDATEAMLHKAADQVQALQREAASESIYAFGDRKHFPFFRDRLPASLQSQAVHAGPVPHRHDERLGKTIRELQESRVRERVAEEIHEFQSRRAEQCHVASGPEAILPLLATGKVARVFLDPAESLPGMKCNSCGSRAPVGRETCGSCGHALAITSMTQEVIAHALIHPPVPLTFVPTGEAWLKDSGGMTALLSEKGMHPRT